MKKLAIFVLVGLAVACGTDDEPTAEVTTDSFDREAMLAHWADNIIVPAYQVYGDKLDALQRATVAFTDAPDKARLADVRAAWLAAYRAWQSVAMFEIGPAEAVALRNVTNIYPTDAAAIEENIRDENYTLDLPSKNDEQGFPALDYLLYGTGDTEADILARYTDAERGDAYRTYLATVVDRLHDLSAQVLKEWTGTYRDTFVSNSGSSGTESVNQLLNDYLFYYEKFLRAAKVGIPAGVFSSTPLPETVEGYYAQDVSDVLFHDALDATQGFFNGRAFGQDAEGLSIKSYLAHLDSPADDEGLASRINAQFDAARTMADGLDSNFARQVVTDNQAMLTTYDALQENVVLMKVDMFQALNVKVDFVDADGD